MFNQAFCHTEQSLGPFGREEERDGFWNRQLTVSAIDSLPWRSLPTHEAKGMMKRDFMTLDTLLTRFCYFFYLLGKCRSTYTSVLM